MVWRNRKNALHYFRRATQFLDAARLLRDDLEGFGDVVAVIAVHGAIALADAIMEGFGTGRSQDEGHATAAQSLRRLCGRLQIDSVGVIHFMKLVKQKSLFSYGNQRLDHNKIKAAVVHLERFTSWAMQTFPLLADESPDDAKS
jgi:hypothetical protein